MNRFAMIAILALAAPAGCGGGTEEDEYTLVKVTGTITRNGQALADAKVAFVPGAGNKNSTPALDQTGPEGNYMLRFKGRMGVAPGKYKVMITPAFEGPGGGQVPAEYESQPAMYRMELEARKRGKPRGSTEAKKAGVVSEFEAEVEADVSSKTLDFDVKALSNRPTGT